jgi:hypothetical protein
MTARAHIRASALEDVAIGEILTTDRGYLVKSDGDTALCSHCTNPVVVSLDEEGVWIDCECDGGLVAWDDNEWHENINDVDVEIVGAR